MAKDIARGTADTEDSNRLRYSVSLVKQGDHQFYTLTIPSEILAQTCVVTTRKEDPKEGFQRTLDEKRAQSIADYIDHERGTIPSSIVLSAQPAAELKIVGRGKHWSFLEFPERSSYSMDNIGCLALRKPRPAFVYPWLYTTD